MGFYTNIYEDAKMKAVEEVLMYSRLLANDAEDFARGEMGLVDFDGTVDIALRVLQGIMDDLAIARAKDVATDLLIDDADFPQMYTQHLIDKDRSVLEEVVDRVWKSGKVEECTYSQTERGVEEAWAELEQTSFEGCMEEEEAQA